MRYSIAILGVLIILTFQAHSQSPEPATNTNVPSVLPLGFAEFTFGMAIDQVATLITDNQYLSVPADISGIPLSNRQVLTALGVTFILDAHFQFDDNRLISIILNLNQSYLDHFKMYSYLYERYGEPEVLNPTSIQWRSSSVLLRLERPLTVKYIAFSTIEEEIEQERQLLSENEDALENFINLF